MSRTGCHFAEGGLISEDCKGPLDEIPNAAVLRPIRPKGALVLRKRRSSRVGTNTESTPANPAKGLSDAARPQKLPAMTEFTEERTSGDINKKR